MPPSDESRRPRQQSTPVRQEASETSVSTTESTAGPFFAAATAREAAFQVLELVRENSRRIADAWQDVQFTAALSPVDRSLSRELAFGVVRREITLDVLLQRLIKRPPSEIEPALRTVLHLGLYQLIFADQIPPHAAVFETVELVKKVGRLRWVGFVNGILRSASRLCTDEFTATASARAIPVGSPPQDFSSLRFRVLAEPVFPDPQTDFLGYFWRAYGIPEWLAARWVGRWPAENLHRLGQWQRMPPPIFLRVNLLKTSRENLLQQFHEAGLDAVPVEDSETTAAVRVLSGGRIEDWPGYREGWFSVQDLAAMQAARRLAPTPGSRVLDLCAAPGGKTCHLAELMGDAGEILATDITPSRLSRIVENAQRLGLKSVHALLVCEDGYDLPRAPFDFILADVPCSNTGVIGRRPEVVRELTLATIQQLSQLQSDLLQRGAERLKVGGRLLYSTCSIEVEENENVIREFLHRHAGFRLIEEHLLLPGAPADGGYQALLERMA